MKCPALRQNRFLDKLDRRKGPGECIVLVALEESIGRLQQNRDWRFSLITTALENDNPILEKIHSLKASEVNFKSAVGNKSPELSDPALREGTPGICLLDPEDRIR